METGSPRRLLSERAAAVVSYREVGAGDCFPDLLLAISSALVLHWGPGHSVLGGSPPLAMEDEILDQAMVRLERYRGWQPARESRSATIPALTPLRFPIPSLNEAREAAIQFLTWPHP